MPTFATVLLLILTSGCCGASTIFPLEEVRAGQKGVGRTVFTGDRIEEFQVEILGVLENTAPGQSVILAKLSGGPLEKTGVIQGMSGSPVYIDGRLLGAVALGFPFSKDPIAGIRPIQDMLAWGSAPAGLRASVGRTGEGAMAEIATPLSMSGFSAGTLEQFAGEFRKLGLEPRQGVSSGGRVAPKMGDASRLRPGDMISVQLLSGDYSVAADGTVTEIDGGKLYAFGHRFLMLGGLELPFARSEVLTTLANVNSSFKISAAKEWMGSILQDRSTGIYGELGRRAATIPLSIEVVGARGVGRKYEMEMVNDRFLSPFLTQMAVFSAIEATERTQGVGSFAIRAEVELGGGGAPLLFENVFSGEFGVPALAATGVASPLSYLMSSGFDSLRVRGVRLSVTASERKRALVVDQVAVSRREVHPGDTVEVLITLAGEGGAEVQRSVRYVVPRGSGPGVLQIAVTDATAANLGEFQQAVSGVAKTAGQVLGLLGGLRSNNAAYVRVSRLDASFQVQGVELPDPPPSVALLLAKSPVTAVGGLVGRGSTVAQFRVDAGDAVVSGSKTVQVEVKE